MPPRDPRFRARHHTSDNWFNLVLLQPETMYNPVSATPLNSGRKGACNQVIAQKCSMCLWSKPSVDLVEFTCLDISALLENSPFVAMSVMWQQQLEANLEDGVRFLLIWNSRFFIYFLHSVSVLRSVRENFFRLIRFMVVVAIKNLVTTKYT